MRNSLVLSTAAACAALTSAVFALAGGNACCQDQKGLFELPTRENKAEPTEGCKPAQEKALALLDEVDRELDEPLKAKIRQAVADRDKDETLGEAWDAAGSVALLNVHVPAALWCSLNAVKVDWRSDWLVQSGIYLAMMDRNDDARLLLGCAYDEGNRSPFLLEALANLAHRANDKPTAVRYINEALATAPDDPFIKIQKHFFNSGSMPPRNAPPQDPVDAAWNEVKAYNEKWLHELKVGEELAKKANEIYGNEWPDDPAQVVASWREGFDQGLQGIEELKRQAKLTPAQFQREFPYAPATLRQQYRNIYFYTLICLHLSVTANRLQGPRPAVISEGYDVGFWAKAGGFDPLSYARMIRAIKDFEFEGKRPQLPGYRLDDWGGARFLAVFEHAKDLRREGHIQCSRTHNNDPEGEKACQLEVDRKFCATSRQAHEQWMAETEAHVQRFARRFDRAAAEELAIAGEIAADGYEYAAKYAKEIKFPPGDAEGEREMRDLNERYRQVVADAVGAGDNGPAARVRFNEEGFQLYSANAQATLHSYKQWIEEICQPVDERVLEKILEEYRKAVSEMLLERLLRDLNVSWDPNADCTFSMGKWISVKIDIDGNVKTKGKWSPYQKAFEGSPSVDAGGGFKFDIKDKRYVTVSVGKDVSKGYGPFTGKAGINAGVQYDTQTGTVSYPVDINASLGVGVKTKYRGQDFGISCTPGSLKAKFDARVVAKDAMDYWNSL